MRARSGGEAITPQRCQRSDTNEARISAVNRSGCSQAGEVATSLEPVVVDEVARSRRARPSWRGAW